MGDTRGRCLVSPSDCPPGDHLPAPAKAGVGVGGDLVSPGRRGRRRWPFSGAPRADHSSSDHRPPGGRGAGLRRLRAPPRLAQEEAGRAALRSSSPSREAPPGHRYLGAGHPSLPARGPPTCHERQMCQPMERRVRRIAPPTCGSKARATSGRGAFPKGRGQSTRKFSLVQPDHRLRPRGWWDL